jgi:hypothetical protein
MLTLTTSDAIHPSRSPSDDALALSQMEERLPPLLSVIAGMVDLTGFFTLGNIFTAHVTGNLVVIAAKAVRGGPLNLAQTLSVPVFILAVAAVWLLKHHDCSSCTRYCFCYYVYSVCGCSSNGNNAGKAANRQSHHHNEADS